MKAIHILLTVLLTLVGAVALADTLPMPSETANMQTVLQTDMQIQTEAEVMEYGSTLNTVAFEQIATSFEALNPLFKPQISQTQTNPKERLSIMNQAEQNTRLPLLIKLGVVAILSSAYLLIKPTQHYGRMPSLTLT